MSAAELASEYADFLQDLRTSAKGTINSLTMVAGENAAAAGAVAGAIEAHLQRCEPALKLPALHLLDSIAKNVGGAYVPLFSSSLAAIFKETWMAVDPPTRHSMERLLKTWWSVFPAATLQPIDAFVASQKNVHSAPHVPPQIATIAQVPQMQQAGAPPMMGVQAQMQQPLVGAGGFNMAVQQPMQQSMGMPALISAMPPPNMQMQQSNGVVGGLGL
eukprot:PRCOL_00006154-RA